jgi:hypothetical protein
MAVTLASSWWQADDDLQAWKPSFCLTAGLTLGWCSWATMLGVPLWSLQEECQLQVGKEEGVFLVRGLGTVWLGGVCVLVCISCPAAGREPLLHLCDPLAPPLLMTRTADARQASAAFWAYPSVEWAWVSVFSAAAHHSFLASASSSLHGGSRSRLLADHRTIDQGHSSSSGGMLDGTSQGSGLLVRTQEGPSVAPSLDSKVCSAHQPQTQNGEGISVARTEYLRLSNL